MDRAGSKEGKLERVHSLAWRVDEQRREARERTQRQLTSRTSAQTAVLSKVCKVRYFPIHRRRCSTWNTKKAQLGRENSTQHKCSDIPCLHGAAWKCTFTHSTCKHHFNWTAYNKVYNQLVIPTNRWKFDCRFAGATVQLTCTFSLHSPFYFYWWANESCSRFSLRSLCFGRW